MKHPSSKLVSDGVQPLLYQSAVLALHMQTKCMVGKFNSEATFKVEKSILNLTSGTDYII